MFQAEKIATDFQDCPQTKRNDPSLVPFLLHQNTISGPAQLYFMIFNGGVITENFKI